MTKEEIYHKVVEIIHYNIDCECCGPYENIIYNLSCGCQEFDLEGEPKVGDVVRCPNCSGDYYE